MGHILLWFTSRYTVIAPDLGLSSRERNRYLVGDPERTDPPVASSTYLGVQKLFAVQPFPMFLVLQVPGLHQIFTLVLIVRVTTTVIQVYQVMALVQRGLYNRKNNNNKKVRSYSYN